MKIKIKSQILLHLVILIAFQQVLNATIINVPDDQTTIQAGINVSSNGDTVLVQPGTYYQNINFNGKNITVASLFLTTGNNSYISETIINGNNSNSVVKFNSGESNDAVLSGFTITNGSAYYGAGVYCYQGSSPSLENLIITDNHGYAGDSYGGGLCFQTDTDVICTNLTITDNSANEGGGIFFHNNGNATMSFITMSGNTSAHGGAMQISYSDPVIDHSVFYANNSPFGGAVYVFNYSSPQFINCTFSQNDADYGGAFYCSDLGGAPIITNCILWNDESSYNNEIFATSSVYPPVVTYSNIENSSSQSWFGTGCINVDPLFLDPGSNDFHLTSDSPCIDSGDPSSPPDPDGSIADMGAYYFEVVLLPGMASEPIPENNANNVSLNQILYWTNGENTETIDVYFGTENPPVDLVLENEPAIETYDPGLLEPETTYYWRVDCKNNAGIENGPVWSFTTLLISDITDFTSQNAQVLLSPNPASDFVNVKSAYTILNIDILNSYGQILSNKSCESNLIKVDVSKYNRGLYFLRIETNKGFITERIFVN